MMFKEAVTMAKKAVLNHGMTKRLPRRRIRLQGDFCRKNVPS